MRTLRERLNEVFDNQEAKGLAKYGKPLEVGDPPSGSWDMEVIQELVDACYYMARMIQDQQAELKVLRDFIGVDGYDNME